MIPVTLPQVREPDLESEVQALYGAELPYHNFQHALDTIDAADQITQRCVKEGIRVENQVVYYALLFHDAGYQNNHVALGFDTKEAYSADLAACRLEQRGVARRTVEKVVAAILSTHKDANFVTVEQKTVRAADLSGLAADYETFVQNSANLKSEYEMFNAQKLSWPEWVEHVGRTIRFYLSQEIRLTSYFANDNGESAFHQAVRENLERLVAEA